MPWLRHRPVERPAFQSKPQGGLSDAHASRPLADSRPLSVPLDPLRASPILGLLSMSGPTTISWLVPKSIVDSVERRCRRAWPHIFEEVLESLPPRTNRHSNASILKPRMIVWIGATTFHRRP